MSNVQVVGEGYFLQNVVCPRHGSGDSVAVQQSVDVGDEGTDGVHGPEGS